jgi:hypothetical protein
MCYPKVPTAKMRDVVAFCLGITGPCACINRITAQLNFSVHLLEKMTLIVMIENRLEVAAGFVLLCAAAFV